MIENVQILEGILFLENNAILLSVLERHLSLSSGELKQLIEHLNQKLEHQKSIYQVEINELQVQMTLKSEVIDLLKNVYQNSQKKKLTEASLEVLGIIAFKQPLTKGDIEKVRGVESSFIIRNLLKEQFIKIIGKKPTLGAPSLYGTTEKFLYYFGLQSLNELPSIEEFKELY